MEVEVRKIQRVGTSSLVVTLPKEWARRLGLQPGSQVLLIDEGDSIRVKPVENDSGGMVVDLSRVPPRLASSVPLCLYLSGYTEAEVAFPDQQSLEEAKARSLNLVGLQIYESLEDPSRARIEVIIDPARVDLPRLHRSLSTIVHETMALLRETLETGEPREDRVGVVRARFLRTHYVVLRHLAARYGARGGVDNYHSALATSYAGFAIDLLQELVLTAPRLTGARPLPEADLERLREVIGLIEEAGDLLFKILAQPSVKRIAELHLKLAGARERAEEVMLSSETRAAAVIAGKLHDIARLLMIAYYTALCRVLLMKKD